jgi:hypothetical protein
MIKPTTTHPKEELLPHQFMDDCKADSFIYLLGDVFLLLIFICLKTEPIGYGKERNILDLFKFAN